MRLSREDLELLLAIAEEGTVTRAATRLHLSQSAVSHHLRALEDRLGATLFERKLRKMILTPSGEVLSQGARQICSEFRRWEERLDSALRSKKRILRLGTECYTSYQWLPRLVEEMGHAAKNVELRIVVEATQRAKAALETGETDAVILQSSGDNPRFRYWNLFRDELLLLVSSRHRLAKRRSAEATDLAGENLILHQVPGRKHAVLDEFLLPAKVYPAQIREVQLTEAIIEMVRANMGVSVLARWLAEPYARDGRIRTLRLGSSGLWREWRVAALQEQVLSQEIGQLSHALASLLKTRINRPRR